MQEKTQNYNYVFNRKYKIKYEDYLKTDHWKELKKTFKSRIKQRCYICHARNTELHVHHKRYRRKGEPILFKERHSDLRLLCKFCHHKLHEYGLEYLLLRMPLKRTVLRDILHKGQPDKMKSVVRRLLNASKHKKKPNKNNKVKFKKMKGVASFPLKGEAGYEQFMKQVQKK